MKILLCAFACDPNGASGLGAGEDVLGWNIARQTARFHQTWVLTHAGNRGTLEQARQDSGLEDRLHFEYVRLPGLFEIMARNHKGPLQVYSWFWQWAAWRAARRLHQQHDFALFHHVTYANDWLASPTGALLPVPYIRGPGGGAHRMPGALLRSRPFRVRVWERMRSLGQWIYRHDPIYVRGRRRARAILLCHPDAVRAVPAPLRNKVQLFPVNGIAPEEAEQLAEASARPEHDREGFRVISAGSFIPLKCFDLGLRAFADFVKSRPDARLELVGDGPERERLIGLAGDLGITHQICFPGWLSRKELIPRMAQADVFLFPSARDGGAAVVVEAMAAGTPVVCLDTGGPGFHVHDDWGIKIAPASPDRVILDMSDALHRLYDDPKLRTRMGTAGKKRVQEVYLWDRLGERLNGIHEDACRVSSVGCRK